MSSRKDKKSCKNFQTHVSTMTVSEADSESVATNHVKFGHVLFAGAWNIFADFSNNSTVHGVKYLGERRRHWAEKMFWIFAFMLSIYGCSTNIFEIYEKWQASPVIVSKPIWEIPFPAVTICPQTKVRKEYLDFTKAYMAIVLDQRENLTVDELKALEAVAQICDPHFFANHTINSGLKKHDIVPLMKSISLSLSGTALFCKWRNEVEYCDQYFTEVLTEEGLCYTFNSLDSKEIFNEDVLAEDYMFLEHNMSSHEWNLEDGYKTKNLTAYPRRALGTGWKSSLNIVLKLTTPDLDYLCRGPVQGFKVVLHTPGELPRFSKQEFTVPIHQDVTVKVKPNMIKTEKSLAGYTPDMRQCYFSDERNLKFFKVYSQANCEVECLANFTLEECGCVKFSMPRDKNTSICSQKEISCYDSAEDGIFLSDLNESLKPVSGKKKRGVAACNCLPSCTTINYDLEISQFYFDFEKVFKAYGADLDEFPDAILARIAICLKETHFMTSKGSEVYGLTDFMSNCGGLLGLFMGVSMFSLIELLYHVTLRLFCNLRNRRTNRIKSRKISEIILNVPEIKIDGPEDEFIKKNEIQRMIEIAVERAVELEFKKSRRKSKLIDQSTEFLKHEGLTFNSCSNFC